MFRTCWQRNQAFSMCYSQTIKNVLNWKKSCCIFRAVWCRRAWLAWLYMISCCLRVFWSSLRSLLSRLVTAALQPATSLTESFSFKDRAWSSWVLRNTASRWRCNSKSISCRRAEHLEMHQWNYAGKGRQREHVLFYTDPQRDKPEKLQTING